VNKLDVVVIGAGAAGLMCAIEAGKRNRQVLVLEKSNKIGKKILMSGGGRCNFTNYHTSFNNYISHNPNFIKSALSRYQPLQFIDLVKKYNIPFHEKGLGQLFCDNKSSDIVNMLSTECKQVAVNIAVNSDIKKIELLKDQATYRFKIVTTTATFFCESLVIATGGLSIPTLGASPFGYKIAEQFDIPVWPTRAGLVPLTLHEADKKLFQHLPGISCTVQVKSENQKFSESMLFTHRGLSGPAILQISSYWHAGQALYIDFLPQLKIDKLVSTFRKNSPTQLLKTVLNNYLPKNLLPTIISPDFLNQSVQQLTQNNINELHSLIHHYVLKPNGTEGYRTAEVTLGGVDCNALSSKTMEVKQVPGLYFIGEVLDVTGWLGGYNFQWAWSSGWAAGQVV